MSNAQPQVFSSIAFDASRTLLGQAQKAQEVLFSAASEQLDVQAKAFNDLGNLSPDAFWNQGAQIVREQANRTSTLMRQLGEIQVETLQSLGTAGRKTADEATQGIKRRK